MTGTLTFNNWSLESFRKIKPGIYSRVFRNSLGWTARDVLIGKDNHVGFLTVMDEKKVSLGTVKSVSELP